MIEIKRFIYDDDIFTEINKQLKNKGQNNSLSEVSSIQYSYNYTSLFFNNFQKQVLMNFEQCSSMNNVHS